jgi:hypothetical protein
VAISGQRYGLIVQAGCTKRMHDKDAESIASIKRGRDLVHHQSDTQFSVRENNTN